MIERPDERGFSPRVLVLAEAANPEWVSVPLVGWNLYRALSRKTRVHLVTHVRNRQAIVRAGLVEGVDFTAIDNEKIAAPLYKLSDILRGGAGKGWTTITAFSSLAYYSFEHELWRVFGSRIKAKEFDLVHRVTPLSPTSQSIIVKRIARAGVPFLVGPLNGGVPWPPGFSGRQHKEREWLAYLRTLYKLMPGYRSTRQYSSAVIAGSKYTLGELPDYAQPKAVYIPENGIDASYLARHVERRLDRPVGAAFIGRLVPYKGADVLIRAAAEFLRSGRLELDIVGDGPQRAELEELTAAMNVQSAIRFHGWQSHGDTLDILGRCDFLALPSIREFGGGVVVEAMALGKPAIVADYAGPSELVDDDTGIRVAFSDEASLTSGFTKAIGGVVEKPERLVALGEAARRRVSEKLTWDAKAGQIMRIYEAVLTGKPNPLSDLKVY